MTAPNRIVRLVLLFALFLLPYLRAADDNLIIPAPLDTWKDWATWNDQERFCPTPYLDATKHLCAWPSVLHLKVDHAAGQFDLALTVFHDSWIALPGSLDVWPVNVKAGIEAVPVVEHDGKPCVHLDAGVYVLTGAYSWDELPQRITLPQAIGVLTLNVEGKEIDAPTWDADGFLWLKRDQAEATDKDFLGMKIYRMIEDGIPMWLHSQVELSVSGKSREEDLRAVLPAGWQLAAIDSPIPVAIDDQGRMKAQVRAGKWTIKFDAFHLTPATEFLFAPGAAPAQKEELIAFKSAPDFRMLDIQDVPSIDVSQTTFPAEWRDLPVYRWDTARPFHLSERMRGMGLQKPEGLKITRDLWLDESGRSLIFRDRISGNMQQIWRLDAAEHQELGSVRSAGLGQLITRNPANGASGVEIRTRNLDLEATGGMSHASGYSATGWRADADSLGVTLNLPPGWRLFALFGADWVQGDWLTAWSLLDIFLLLIFTLAVYRMEGLAAGLLAFVAFGIAYHEPGSPRYLWLLLLMPLGLLKVVRSDRARRWLQIWKYILVAALVIDFVPFAAGQIQQVLYPQLENTGLEYDSFLGGMAVKRALLSDITSRSADSGGMANAAPASLAVMNDNLAYDSKARIQTGPGLPEWSWRTVKYGWNGPVQASQKVYPMLVPPWLYRVLSILRVALLIALAVKLLDATRLKFAFTRKGSASRIAALVLAIGLATGSSASAQIPDKETLAMLRDRLTETSDAYPNAADIPQVSLSLHDRHLIMDAEIDTIIRVAVPLPGRLPAWSPVKVLVDGKPNAVLRRDDGYLWIVLPAGVHQVHVEGLLADVTEWEWTFQLKWRHVTIDAAGWSFNGVRANGIPEQQVFFSLKQKAATSIASYDRQELHAIAAVDRHLELGLVWQVHNEVSRLSPADRAIAIRVPLLPGEKVLSSNVVPQDGFVEVRLGASEKSYAWDSEISPTDHLTLATRTDDSWVERWYLVASPVWNVTMSGLAPVFEPASPNLVPVWHPWPGENVALTISRPEAVSGATVTVRHVDHVITLGSRQRTSQLDLQLQCSLGEDFAIDLPPDAEITSLTKDSSPLPVRKDGTRLVIPLHPGEQTVSVQWKTNLPLGLHASADAVRLPVEAANINTTINVPGNRWVLWTNGPLRGPAVQFWVIIFCALIAAQLLARLNRSPLSVLEWTLLSIGLTQVDLFGFFVIGWLFLLAWRGSPLFQNLPRPWFNLMQVGLVILSAISLQIFLVILGDGLLGHPEMFIAGNGSTGSTLKWYEAESTGALPLPGCLLISIWCYRFLMLAWALWLAFALIRWIAWGWGQFGTGGFWRKGPPKPPKLPKLSPTLEKS